VDADADTAARAVGVMVAVVGVSSLGVGVGHVAPWHESLGVEVLGILVASRIVVNSPKNQY